MAATLIHNTGQNYSGQEGGGAGGDTVTVFETGQHLSTLIDSLKLNMRAVDEILPTLRELVTSVSRI